jgi:hypothetical protein
MPLDAAFLDTVAPLRLPQMGTERVAPILYHLLHLARPRRVLEVGMGYTTPFIALALKEARDQARAEAAAFQAKTGPYLAGGRPLDRDWLHAPPPLAAPGFYQDAYEPVFVAIDHFGQAGSAAGQVQDVLRTAGLAEMVTVIDARLSDARPLLPTHALPLDFAWVDAWECLYFFDHFWADLDPDGGLLLMHYLLTYPEGEAVLEYIKATQRLRPDELELVSLLEPHKLTQNSLTLIRKVSGYTDPVYASANRIDYEGVVRDQAARALAAAEAAEAVLPPGRSAGGGAP